MSSVKIPTKHAAPIDLRNGDDFAACFNVSRETLARLSAYQALLGKWQKSVNLVGPSTLDQFWGRHAADSAQILRHAPIGARNWLDLGSGAGFPGLILAIMLAEQDPQARLQLVESDRKKANFLRTVIRECGLTAVVHHMRIEALGELSKDCPPEGALAALCDTHVITARALAALPLLAGLMAPFFNSSTIALLHKGRDWQDELTQARQYWTLQAKDHASMTDPSARLIELTGLAPKTA